MTHVFNNNFPTFFLPYLPFMFQDGININGVQISPYIYAIDRTQRLIDRLNTIIAEFNRKINTVTTTVVIFSTPQNIPLPITLNDKMYSHYCWLNRKLDEIKNKHARSVFTLMKVTLCDPHLNLGLKLRFLKFYVWPLLLCDVETWTITISVMNKIEAYEMSTFRRIPKIPAALIRQTFTSTELFHNLKTWKTYLGHVQSNFFLELMVTGQNQRKMRNWKGSSDGWGI